MRKLVESTLASLDGVIGSPDRWSLFDEESSRWTLQELDISASGSMRCPSTSRPGH